MIKRNFIVLLKNEASKEPSFDWLEANVLSNNPSHSTIKSGDKTAPEASCSAQKQAQRNSSYYFYLQGSPNKALLSSNLLV